MFWLQIMGGVSKALNSFSPFFELLISSFLSAEFIYLSYVQG